jgi:hypothetical protein
MNDDAPLDLAAVAADEAALEALRAGAGDDAALMLLRELLLDVERDLAPTAPLSHGTTVLARADAGPERRLARNGTVVAALTAGLLSLGGVAAASTFAPADSPLHGLGEAVRSAAGAVVGAVTPPTSPGRSAVVLPTPSASPTTAPTPAPAAKAAAAPRTPTPGATVSAASRSRAAARQVDQLLVAAADLLKAGRTTAAVSRLTSRSASSPRCWTPTAPTSRSGWRPCAPRPRPAPPRSRRSLRGPRRPGRRRPRRTSRPRRRAAPAPRRPRATGPRARRPLGQSSDRAASMNPRA